MPIRPLEKMHYFHMKDTTTMTFKTDQEEFWAGDFGESYISRNQSASYLASNVNFFSTALRSAGKITSCIEFGANIGVNLKALKVLFPDVALHGIEINTSAAAELRQFLGQNNTIEESILTYESKVTCDISLIKGVLIHINPNELDIVYEKLYASTNRYLLVCEYYNPTPTTVNYRGHSDRLFKRDFAGELLDKYSDLVLRDYGFSYHRDVKFPQDDITWFLLEKS